MRETKVLTRYKAWADDMFLSALSFLPDTELTAPRPIVFGSLIRMLNHAYQLDRVWKCHLLGKPHGLTTRNPQDCPDLAEVVEFEFIGGGTGQMSRRDILMHVVNHTTYHRGHAAGILYQPGVSPPTTDFPVFLRETFDGT